MKHRNQLLRTAFVVLVFTNVLLSQTINIDGYTFRRQQGKWYKEYLGKLFEVSTRSITIKVRNGVLPRDIEAFHRANNIDTWRENSLGCTYISLPEGADPIDYVMRYRSNRYVEWAEVSTFGRFLSVPNDPRYGSQWYLERIRMPSAWNIAQGNPSVIVGILDSGTDWLHPDIGPTVTHNYQNVWLNETVGPNGTTENDWADPTNPASGQGDDDDGNGTPNHSYIDDWKGWLYSGFPTYEGNDSRGVEFAINPHGTHVAGIVAAKTHNSVGIAGIAGGWNGSGIRMMILGFYFLEDQDPADAISYAVTKGAKVIQLSLEGSYTKVVALALDAAHNAGRFIACASGNNDPAITFPANYPVVVAVGATNETDMRASFSNFGPELDLAAPGTNILTTSTVDSLYKSVAGTSYSSPQVSALAALVWCVDPSLTNLQVEDIIKSTADKVGGYNYNWDPGRPGHSQELGYGRINAYRALSKANGAPSIRQINSITIAPVAYPQLNWTLAPEVDVQDGGLIAIERRTKAIIDYSWSAWTVIATLNGNATLYIDSSIARMCTGNCPDSVQYRIRAQDYAGLYSPDYSIVVTITAYGIWYKRKADIAVAPLQFRLFESYPNPFNPSTTIGYSLPDQGYVTLRVYDVLGKEIATLVNEEKPAGEYSVVWNAENFSSGVYYYRLSVGSFTQTRKMLLLQ